MIRPILSVALVVLTLTVSAQNFGNSALLKYGFTQNDMNVDISFHGFDFSNSPSKWFILRNQQVNQASIGSRNQPVSTNLLEESSGESIYINGVTMLNGYSLGYIHTNNIRNQGHLTWNRSFKPKGKTRKYQITGYAIGSDQQIDDSRNQRSWTRQEQNVSSYLKITNYKYQAKNSLTLDGFIQSNKSDFQRNLLSQRLNEYRETGDLILGRLNWQRQVSTNHSLNSSLSIESFQFNHDLTIPVNYRFNHVDLHYRRVKLRVRDEIRFKYNKLANGLSFIDNRQKVTGKSTPLTADYRLALWLTELTHYFNSNKIGIKYKHGLGSHSEDGLVFNPGLKFFHVLKKLKYDLGFNLVSRTPALMTEFSTLYDQSIENQLTVAQEHITQLFGTTQLALSNKFTLEFKYVQTSSRDKWLYNPLQNKITPQRMRYSAFYTKLLKSNHERRSFTLLYRYITPETTSAEILAQHYASGAYEYKIYGREMRLFKRNRYFDFFANLKTAYMSKYQLPFREDGKRAIHRDAFFGDAHFKFRIGSRYGYYYEDHKPVKIENIILVLGITNFLNTSASVQPFSANDFRPVLPRQVFTGITLEF
jgi:hypothetical protein